MLFNSKGSTNRLQQQQIWSICFTAFSIFTWKRPIASLVMESFTSGGNAKFASSLKRKSSSKITGLTAERSSSIRFAGIDWPWRRQRLRGGIVGVKIFEGGPRTFLFDVCSCLGAKDLRDALDRDCRKKRSWPWGHPRPQRRGGELPSGTRRVSGNPFILVKNVVTDCWTIAMNVISHSKWMLVYFLLTCIVFF